MKIIKPKKLKKGDLIGIISPASPPDDPTRIDKGVKYLESLGYQVELGKNVQKSIGYLAGSDKERLQDLHDMFSNKAIKAIICTRGGYGTPRLLNKIDYDLIAKNPKIFVGYSDITSLQMAILAKTKLVTFAGPMLAVDFWNEVNKYAEENFWKILSSTNNDDKINMPPNYQLKIEWQGKSEGELIGGNLAHLVSSFGTKFIPKFKNKILLIEDITEAPYRVDRMLCQLKNGKVFEKISGLILGQFTDCEEKDASKKTFTLNQVFDDFIKDLSIPVISNFPHGHIKENLTIPFGVNVKLNAIKGFVEFTESAVE